MAKYAEMMMLGYDMTLFTTEGNTRIGALPMKDCNFDL
jgi:hypothetical protein